jgi:flagellar biosynthesis protein FliQ
MDLVIGLIRAGLTLAAIVVVIGLVAALFMIFFNLATGIDERISE